MDPKRHPKKPSLYTESCMHVSNPCLLFIRDQRVAESQLERASMRAGRLYSKAASQGRGLSCDFPDRSGSATLVGVLQKSG